MKSPETGINPARNWRHVDESTGGICRAAAAWIWPTSGRSCWAFHRTKTIQNARKHSENYFTRLFFFFFSGPHFQTHLHFSFLIIFEVHLRLASQSPIPHVVGSKWWQKRGGSFKFPKAWWKWQHVAAGETAQFFQPSRSWKVFFRTINRSDDLQRIPWNQSAQGPP